MIFCFDDCEFSYLCLTERAMITTTCNSYHPLYAFIHHIHSKHTLDFLPNLELSSFWEEKLNTQILFYVRHQFSQFRSKKRVSKLCSVCLFCLLFYVEKVLDSTWFASQFIEILASVVGKFNLNSLFFIFVCRERPQFIHTHTFDMP